MAAGLPVIVSSRCGCARDLVDDGGNGFIFEPGVPEVLAGCLAKMARLNDEQRAAMGIRSREIIRQYSPEAFAAGLEAAIECAVASQAARKSWLGRALVNLAALRSIPIDHSLLL
jgi:glycosyltransferase involved in cell wall biosynthesis